MTWGDDTRFLFDVAPDLFRRAPDAMIVVDAAGEIRLVNEQALILTGWVETELVRQPVEVLVPPASRAVHEGFRAGYVQDPHTRAMGAGLDLELVRADGGMVPVEINLAVIVTPLGPMTLTALRRRGV